MCLVIWLAALQRVQPILRLEEWLVEFGKHPNLKMLWFDVKVEATEIFAMARKLLELLSSHAKSGKIRNIKVLLGHNKASYSSNLLT